MPITVKRKNIRFNPDPARVIPRFFLPGGAKRALSIVENVMQLPDEDVCMMLNQVLRNFSNRHRNISKIFETHFKSMLDELNTLNPDTQSGFSPSILHTRSVLRDLALHTEPHSIKRRLLIGSYFTMEYSIESTAFFNPSIVEDPDQSNLAEEGQKRVIMSFRATGEGHISSIVFRSGIIDKNNNIDFEPAGKLVDIPEKVKRHVYDKAEFLARFTEMNIFKKAKGKDRLAIEKTIKRATKMVMDRLEDRFIYGKFRASILEFLDRPDLTHNEKKVVESMNWLANSHYEIEFSLDTAISERVIFPISYAERNGIEDARFVRFINTDSTVKYYATYTAFNGDTIIPKFLETLDFYHFKISPMNGKYAQNKGMALFPRKIKGKYMMVSRYDGVSNYVMSSDQINLWQSAKKIESPSSPWEYVQVGNSGSPIETSEGWLLLTHGVGPMRKYCIGALLLDLDKPEKVIGRLKEPLLTPSEVEREGYVPNVVYSCGSMIHNNELILPYAMSDTASTYATIPMDELLNALLKSKDHKVIVL